MRNRLLFSDRAAKVINDRARSVLGGDFREYHIQQPASYDKSLSLVDELREPADEHTYLGSPFVSLGILPEKYAEKFKEQLSTESRHCLKVRNICRNSTKCPAEDLVRQWQWRETLEKCLAEHINQLQQYPLKAYLSILDPSECACLMLSSLLVICSQGQELVPCSQVEYALAEPILDVIHQKFTDKLIEDKENLFLELFNEYIRYFLDATLSRCYTPREWWIRCTRKAKIDPEFRLPLADFHSSVRRDLGSFLLRVVLEACIFTSSGCSVNAFTLRNVTLQEESVLCDDGRLQLCKMVKLSRRMLDLFMHHQFEWLLFPTEHLPIKVPPRPWIDCGGGGPSYLKPSYVLRDLYEYRDVSVNTEVQRRLSKRSQGRPVFDALNDLGSTPWRINKPVLDILLEVFKMTADSSKADMLAKLSFPLRSDTVVVPDYIATFGANKKVEEIPTEEWRRYSKSKYDAIKLKNELNSLWYWLMYRLVMAEHFRDDILFLPHNMDFRGRVYPISPYLSHMGDDINRSLLLFAQGKRLGTDGFRWLKLHCINLTGHMKRSSIEDRIKASDILLPKMIASAKDPLHGLCLVHETTPVFGS
ncbi:hypothetical protein AB6A40_008461 [Gnathostoma spinigerum]|uniref:DNA-directed RNA polymerase n=1 Tax=Gnathostoma spinigerum TaxID=75299 RepID=A0ABD6EYH5_9BILA